MNVFFLRVTVVAILAITALPGRPAGAQLKPSAETNGRQVIQDMSSANFAKVEAQFDARMAAALPPGKLGQGWSAIASQFGAFQAIASAQTTKVQTYDMVRMVLQFEKGMLDATVSFDPEGTIAGIVFRPHQEALQTEDQWAAPSYAHQSSFTEKPLELQDQGYELPGTLTLPNGPGPFPAIVLVPGSGPQDEDETIGPNKPFKDLAWGLASRGIAVYRYTKRTQKYGEKSAADPKLLTVNDETISDARAAVALVAQQPGINPEQVFLLGHSLGAYLAPRIATGNAIIAGIVIMGGNTKPMEQLIVEQIRYLANAGETPPADGESQVDAAQRAAEQIESRDLKPDDEVPLLGSTTYGATGSTSQLQSGEDRPKTQDPYPHSPGRPRLSGHSRQLFRLAIGARQTRKRHPEVFPGRESPLHERLGPGSPKDYEKPGHVAPDVIDAIATWLLPSPNPGSLKGPN